MKNESRREFIKKSTLASFTALLGSTIAFGEKIPKNYIPILLDENPNLPGKHKDLIVLNDKPWNVETPAHLLNDAVTPIDKMFIRNNGLMPKEIDVNNWTLTIEGESVNQIKTYSLQDLKTKFKHHTYQLTLECGGNGRAEFNPPAKGNQWALGAVHSAKWTGVRLKDVLADVGIKSSAVYIGYYGKDIHLSKNPKKVTISRGVPIDKAMEDETLLAFQLNGDDIPIYHGHPLRLVVGGWPASTSGKWLHKISVRNIVHDGPKMTGTAYRVPCKPIAPGEEVKDEDMCIIEAMPVKSLITYPKTGAMLKEGKTLKINGQAWAGDLTVKEMFVSIDFGATWKKCALTPAPNKNAWQQWNAQISFPQKGYYEVWAKAKDEKGNEQPMVVPGWNPKGYLNNACHRIAIKVI